MEDFKISDDKYDGYAEQIIEILADDYEMKIISQFVAIEILFPILSQTNPVVDILKPPESWFQKVDRDGDGQINSLELAAHLRKYSVRCSKDFFGKLEEVGKLYKVDQPLYKLPRADYRDSKKQQASGKQENLRFFPLEEFK